MSPSPAFRPGQRALVALLSTCVAAPLVGQEPPDSVSLPLPAVRPVAAQRAAPEPLPISPRGAFLRALVVPGWGHAAIGSHTRGGFYVGAQAASLYTLQRIRLRLRAVEARVRFREDALRERLAAAGVTDPTEIGAALDEDPLLDDARELLDARREQQEDLVALSLFLVLLSGADAYVSAHLGRFPAPLDVEAVPNGAGGVDVGVRVTLPN